VVVVSPNLGEEKGVGVGHDTIGKSVGDFL